MPDARRCYWDACVFLSLIEGTPDRVPVIQAVLDEADRGDVEIYTSMLSITEVAFAKSEKDGKALDADVEEKIDKLWLPASPFELVEVHEAITRDAKALIRTALESGRSLKPADAIHLATASRMGVSEFHTYDEKLLKVGDLTSFTISNPKTDSFVWPSEQE